MIALRTYQNPKVQLMHAPSIAWWEVDGEGYDIYQRNAHNWRTLEINFIL